MVCIKELAVPSPKPTQKCLGKKLHCICFMSSTAQLFQDSCPSLPTQVTIDINFLPSNISLTFRPSYQQALYCCQLAKTERSKSR